MRIHHARRVTLVCLLGCAAGASGRNVPVYREYSQPIFFYDETGSPAVFAAAAPDLAAMQLLRDAQAQEGLMGKQTLLDLVFDGNASVFDMRARVTAMASPTAGSGQDVRRRPSESSRNWLAKSLTLPSLGQKPENPATSAMSAGAKESNWGWLADEVADQSGVNVLLPEDLPTDENAQLAAVQGNPRTDDTALFGTDRIAAKMDKETKKTELTAPGAGSSPQNTDLGQKPKEALVQRSEAPARSVPGGDRAASTSIQSYRAASEGAELSQTRQILAGLSAGARPDFAAMRAALVAAPTRQEKNPESGPGQLRTSRLDMESRAGAGAGNASLRLSSSSGWMQTATPGFPVWQGGWSPQNAGADLSSTRLHSHADPVPVSMTPATQRGSARPALSSGGYKPGWY